MNLKIQLFKINHSDQDGLMGTQWNSVQWDQGSVCQTICALFNVDAPGCGTSVVRGPTGHK